MRLLEDQTLMIDNATGELVNKLSGFGKIVAQAQPNDESVGASAQLSREKQEKEAQIQARAEADAKAKEKEQEEAIAKHREANVAKKIKEHADMEARRENIEVKRR